MTSTTEQAPAVYPVSRMAEQLIGSEIIKLANEINEKIKQGQTIANLTIGDFDPSVFPIPEVLLEEIINAYRAGETNYPVANGMAELRKAVSSWISRSQSLEYSPDEVLITGGARPAIYGIYTTLIDPGDKVVYPVPSWNNNHYCHLLGAKGVQVEVSAENNFLPDAESLKPYLANAKLLALCSPQNPTGTVFSEEQLRGICELVLEENSRRPPDEKPLYVMYDQIYSALTYNDNMHVDPVSLFPAMRPYTIYVDGISKSFAATGVRVGWAFGPKFILDKMKAILSHIGAWAPRAEQIAAAKFLSNQDTVDSYLKLFKNDIEVRLNALYHGFRALNAEGYNVDCIEPMAAIYLTIRIDLKGKTTASGKKLVSTADVTSYILEEAKIALVPFAAFGASEDSSWYRLSVGTCRTDKIPGMIEGLRKALALLS